MSNEVRPLDSVRQDPELLAAAMRQNLRSLLDSYHSPVDVLGEPIQNAVDEVTRPDASRPGVVEVIVDVPDNALEVQDNGRGMTQAEVIRYLVPNITGKQEAFRRGETRGHKGVGLSYLAYGFAECVVECRTEVGDEHFGFRITGGRAWAVGDGAAADEPVAHPLAVSDLVLQGPGTRVRIVLSGEADAVEIQSIPHTMGRYLPTAKYAASLLETATAIGLYSNPGSSRPSFEAHLTYISETGSTEHTKLANRYRFPHENVGTKVKVSRLSKVGTGERYDAIWDLFDTDALVEMLEHSTGRTQFGVQQLREALHRHRVSAYAMRAAAASVRDEIGRAWGVDDDRLKDKSEIHAPRIALATDRMISTWRRPPSLTHVGFSVDRIWIIFHGFAIQPDMGRKEFPPVIQEVVSRLQDEVANRIERETRPYLFQEERKSATTRGQSLSERLGAKRAQAWDDPSAPETVGATLQFPPDNEQEVVALFSQLCSLGGPLSHFRPLLMHSSDKYDSYFVYDPAFPLDDRVDEALPGKSGLARQEGWAEFKFRGAALGDDLRTGVKVWSDMTFLVCWEVGSPQRKVGSDELRISSPSSASDRRFPGVTHVASWTGAKDHTLYVISLRDLLREARGE